MFRPYDFQARSCSVIVLSWSRTSSASAFWRSFASLIAHSVRCLLFAAIQRSWSSARHFASSRLSVESRQSSTDLTIRLMSVDWSLSSLLTRRMFWCSRRAVSEAASPF